LFAFAFLVVIPAGDLLLYLPFCRRERNELSTRHPERSEGSRKISLTSSRLHLSNHTFSPNYSSTAQQ
jgi:hypothetical protein